MDGGGCEFCHRDSLDSGRARSERHLPIPHVARPLVAVQTAPTHASAAMDCAWCDAHLPTLHFLRTRIFDRDNGPHVQRVVSAKLRSCSGTTKLILDGGRERCGAWGRPGQSNDLHALSRSNWTAGLRVDLASRIFSD